jgi:photosystem II stability/assembly factor-like uncharacterized protein
VYVSEDKGRTWRHCKNLPISQFYNCEVAQAAPARFYGGTQDNGTIMTFSGANNDWYEILGGDGFHVIVDPEISDFIYAEYQWGNLFRSVDGGNSFQWALNGVANEDRKNWNTPVKLDPSNTSRLYYGTNRLYRSVNRASSWQVISPDLTKAQNLNGGIGYGTISTIAISPVDDRIIYVGTDDGNVQVTVNGGQNWEKIAANLPNRYVTSILAHPTERLTAYVTYSGFRDNDYLAHVWKTSDGGQNWTSITRGLPDVPVNKILIDNKNPQIFYLATDLGVWVSENGGDFWLPLGTGLPAVVITDLVIHKTKRTLVASTYGRSLYEYALDAVPPTYPGLEASSPNFVVQMLPVESTVQITIYLENSTNLGIQIFDLKGNQVAQLTPRLYEMGEHTIPIPEKNLINGIYVAKIHSAHFSTAKQFLYYRAQK